jgi:hypothetical protein
MALGATLAPRTEQPDPPIDGHSGGASAKTNQPPRVGLGAMGPTSVSLQGLVCSPHPDLCPQKVGHRRPAREDRDLQPQPSEGRGALDDLLAPS